MAERFIKNKEDFTCEHCGERVTGTGYTNHCPSCLVSKHVDVWPGDRAERCQGLMPLVGYVALGDSYILIHKCERCGLERKNRLQPDDNLAALVPLQ